MGDNDDGSEQEKLIKAEFARIKKEMHTRVDQLMEQLSTFVTQQSVLMNKIKDVETASSIHSANLLIHENDLHALTSEIVALENFLATKDPELKKIIDKNSKVVKKITEKAKNVPPRKRNP